MSVGGLILVEPSLAGNIGAALRVSANFGVKRIDIVRPAVRADNSEVRRWACGADDRIECRHWDTFQEASAHYHTLAASASGRGRRNLPVLSPAYAIQDLIDRGLDGVALVFGNESTGLKREDLDRCDLVIRVPTEPAFPVLNLAQSVAILVSMLHGAEHDSPSTIPEPAAQGLVDGLMTHLAESLSMIGFLDPQNPQRVLRQLRQLFGRAGITADEVKILRGICRQMEWAAGAKPGRFAKADLKPDVGTQDVGENGRDKS